MSLNDIPKTIQGPNQQDVFYLLGVVDFDGRDIQEKCEMGHFITYSFRGNEWVQYDDNKTKAIPHSGKSMVKAKAILYFKPQLPDTLIMDEFMDVDSTESYCINNKTTLENDKSEFVAPLQHFDEKMPL